MASYVFKIPMDSPLEKKEQVLSWLKNNCPSYITNNPVFNYDDSKMYYGYWISEEKDYIWAKLRWG